MPNSPDNHQNPDAGAFLMQGSVPSASFLKIGTSVTGRICEPPTVQQQRDMETSAPKTWDDGSPMLQLVVTLQTDERDNEIEDDDGRRRIYIKFNMKKAVADAVRKAKAKALEVGGELTVKYVKNGEQTKKGFSPPKLYEASYVPPADGFLNEPDKGGEDGAAPQIPAGRVFGNVAANKLSARLIAEKRDLDRLRVFLKGKYPNYAKLIDSDPPNWPADMGGDVGRWFATPEPAPVGGGIMDDHSIPFHHGAFDI